MAAIFAGVAHAVGDCKDQHGGREGDQNAHDPGELDVVGVPFDTNSASLMMN